MEMRQQKSKWTRQRIAIVLLVLIIAVPVIAYAYLQWTKRFVWGAGFEVRHEDMSTLWTAGTETLPANGKANFWVVNIGNVDITVAVVLNSDPVGITSANWTPTLPQNIAMGNGVWFNLTITQDPTADSGSYDFHFDRTA